MERKKLLKNFLLSLLFLAVCVNVNAAKGNMSIGGTNVSNLEVNASGTGWTWNAASETLTLTNTYAGAYISVFCQMADTINLNYNGNVTISNGAADGLYCEGSLFIDGSNGTLSCSYTGNEYIYSAITTMKSLTINSGNINIMCAATSQAGATAASVYARGGFNIIGNANVTASTTGGKSSGFYTELGNSTISTSGSFTANATDIGYAIHVANSYQLTINNGTINLSNNNASENMIRSGSFEMTGGIVKYNNGTPPTLTSPSPTSGSYNTNVVLSGNNLQNTKKIWVGKKETTSFTVNNNSQVTFVTPSGLQGLANIALETTGGISVLQNKFTYTNTSYRVKIRSAGILSGRDLGFVDTEGDKIMNKPTTPTLSGYTFSGWYKDYNCTEEWNFATEIVKGDTYIYAKFDTGSSINDINADNAVKIYSSPNNISIESLENIKSVDIFDMNGKLLHTSLVNSNQKNVNTSLLAKGVYAVKVTTETAVVVKKVIKQ